MKSNLFSLNFKDLIKGFIMAVGGALTAGIYRVIETGVIDWTWRFWQPVVYTSIGAGLVYLMKNLFTNSSDQFAKPEK